MPIEGKKQRPTIRVLLIVVASVALGFFLLGENLHAQWNIIDDHTIIEYFNTEQTVHIWEIPQLLRGTEIASFGNWVRYRPTYHLLRITEAWLFGSHVSEWYSYILFSFACVIALSWWITSEELGFLSGLAFIVFILSHRYWRDIWTRLGPGETYVVLGVAIFAWSYYRIAHQLKISNAQKRNRPLWFLLMLGALIAIGSKENFLLLIVPTVYLYIRANIRQKTLTTGLFSTFVVLGYCTLISTAVILGLMKTGFDVYQNPISLSAIFPIIVQAIQQTFSNLQLIPLAVLLLSITLITLHFTRNRLEVLQVWKHYGPLLIFLSITYIWQIIFYYGKWPNGNRYDFPGILAKEVFWLICFLSSMQLLKKTRIPPSVLQATYSGCTIILLICALQLGGFTHLREATSFNVLRTTRFTRELEAIAHSAAENPAMPIVIELGDCYAHYECTSSLGAFLGLYRITNPLFIRLQNPMRGRETPLNQRLCNDLEHLSAQGYQARNFSFEPLKQLTTRDCISITFDQAPPVVCSKHSTISL